MKILIIKLTISINIDLVKLPLQECLLVGVCGKQATLRTEKEEHRYVGILCRGSPRVIWFYFNLLFFQFKFRVLHISLLF